MLFVYKLLLKIKKASASSDNVSVEYLAQTFCLNENHFSVVNGWQVVRRMEIYYYSPVFCNFYMKKNTVGSANGCLQRKTKITAAVQNGIVSENVGLPQNV